jgi:hypothetical protein
VLIQDILMMRTAYRLVIAAAALVCGQAALAKLPPPSDEAKAKAAEAAAKTAHGGKVAEFQLCKSQDRAAASHVAAMKQAGKEAKPATPTTPCADPGPYVPAAAASSPAATAATAATAPAASPAVAPAAPAAAANPAAAAPAKKT